MALTTAQAALLSTPDLEMLFLVSQGATTGTLPDLWSQVAPGGKRLWYLNAQGLPPESLLSVADALSSLLVALASVGRAPNVGSNQDKWRGYLIWSLTGSLPS